jgi:hypothetical protein
MRFKILIMKLLMLVFWVVKPCEAVAKYHFREHTVTICRAENALECCLLTGPYDVTTQKTSVDMMSVVFGFCGKVCLS